MSGELPEERWLPTQSPETILLSVISLLSDPNTSSPANVDSNVEWMRKREDFKKRVKKLVDKSIKELPADFEMPKPKPPKKPQIEEDLLDSYYETKDEDFVLDEYDDGSYGSDGDIVDDDQ